MENNECNDFKIMLEVENAFYDGAYSTVQKITQKLINQGKGDCRVLLFSLFSEMGNSSIESINKDILSQDLKYTFNKVKNECITCESAKQYSDDILTMCLKIKNTLKEDFEAKDKELSQQYQGSTGINISSENDADKIRENIEREHNNLINKKRYNLRNKYFSIVETFFNSTFTLIFDLEPYKKERHNISLELIEKIELVKKYSSDDFQDIILKWCNDTREARNDKFWDDNIELKNNLMDEKKQLENKIDVTFKTSLLLAQKTFDKASEDREKAKKERKRYALFNFADRSPLTKIIKDNKRVEREQKEIIKKLNNGICEECEPFRIRISEINNELTKQR